MIGSGSTSFEMLRHLSERLWVRGVPLWLRSKVQPIALTDVVQALVGALHTEAETRSYDVREAGRLIADVGSWLELRAAFGQAYVTALARIGGRPVDPSPVRATAGA